MWILIWCASAFADTLVLDNGAVLTGSLASYEHGGDCAISVTEGDLRGAVVTVPCTRLARFEKDPDGDAIVQPLIEEIALPQSPAPPPLVAAPVEARESPTPAAQSW
jgi:hypothetical protein